MTPHIKKFSIIFLIVALVTSSSTWGFSALLEHLSSPANEAIAEATPTETINLNGKAFSEYLESEDFGAGPDGQNLTRNVADIFAQNIAAINPGGPQVLEDGSVSIFSPQTSDLVKYLSENRPRPEVLDPHIDESRLKTANLSKDNIVAYLRNVSDIQSEVSSDPMWQNAISLASSTNIDAAQSNSNLEWVSQSSNIITDAREEMYDTATPEPFMALHKSIINIFSTASAYSQVAAKDPVGAAALAQDLGFILDRQSADIDKAQAELLGSLPEILASLPQEDRPFIAKLFAVKVAQAQLFTIDPAQIATTIAQWARWFAANYKQIALSLALGYLKTTLLQELSQKIIEWAQGTGAPGYVTNWLVYQAQSAIGQAHLAVDNLSSALCGNSATNGVYGEIIASIMGSPSGSGSSAGTIGDSPGCASRSQRDLYGMGGITAFTNAVRDNIWIDLISVKGAARSAAAAALTASINEATAGSGFIDTKKCDDGSTPSRAGYCEDGAVARTASLGTNIKDLASKSLTSVFDQITGTDNENMLSTLANAATSAIITYIIDEGSGIFSSSRSGDGGGGGADGTTPPPPTPTDDISQTIRTYATTLARAEADTKSAINAVKGAVEILRNAAQSCVESQAVQAIALADQFQETVDSLEVKLEDIQSKLATVRSFQQDPSSHTNRELVNAVGSLQEVWALQTGAAEDSQFAEEAVTQANEFIQTCTSV